LVLNACQKNAISRHTCWRAAVTSPREQSTPAASFQARIAAAVTDRGAGIPEAGRAHLFEAGATGRNGRNGLGLAIRRLTARQLGADLGLIRTAPTGTGFRITLAADGAA
jgi:signal transduction histidine kinase